MITVTDILNDVAAKNPNDVPKEQQMGWIAELERLLCDEVLLTHELNSEEAAKAAEIQSRGYVSSDYTPLVQPPYHGVYVHYVNAQIALLNLDNDMYENEQQLYNNALLTYKNYFNRNHRARIGGQRWRI